VASDVYPRVAVSILFLATVALLAIAGLGPTWLFAVYCAASALTFFTYGADKSAARDGRRRVAESSLHLMALAGGWPGALVAQPVFHHKTKKQPFQGIFWGTVVGNCVLLTVFLAASAVAPG